ncbi:hypothetical protein Cgig2_009067 [Carnegiea gigantea]|uniref:Uncharacterized protein n=1 Tax=Carnegiea gigantea TaxID=171969 RepID=A0A9Q1JTL0_9CARY|nr:hypothetical protein Cgig2_009067 [Carnegiea gigantea]
MSLKTNSNEELNSKRHAAHDKQTEKEKEKEELPNQPVDKVAEKRKRSKAGKPLSKKAKRDNGYRTLRVRKGHVSDVEPSNSSDSEENDPTYECEEVNHENEQIEVKEEVAICQPIKAARKRNKPSLQSKGNGAALVLVKVTSSGKKLQIVREELALKSDEGASEKRTYQKAFITRILIGFASFLKVDVKQIPGKFSKWLVESFDLYAVCFRLPDGQKFPITAFDVHATLGVPLGGTEIIKITKSSVDEEYDEVHVAWVKEWKLQKNAPELT